MNSIEREMQMRNVKVLGLALVAMLAMTAVVANAASAAKITTQTGKYPANAILTQTNENVLSNGIRSFTCKKANLNGNFFAAAESLTISTVAYAECTANGGIPVTISMNGCDYNLVVTSFAAPTTTGHMKIECPTGKEIELTIYASAANHTAGTVLCTLKVGPQTITGITGTNEGAGTASHIGLTVASKNLVIKRTTGTAANCGAAETKAGTYNGKIDAVARNEGGEAAGLLVD